MTSSSVLTFGPFRLDFATQTLWHGQNRLTLKPKSFAVLQSLVKCPQHLVTKDELLNTHWGDVAVGDAVLKTCIAEIRQALGDSAQTPRFIETVHRRGYRFVATPTPIMRTIGPTSANPLVGREQELRQLQNWWERANNGDRQIVFVTGEPGIGKTRLVETFLDQITVPGDAWIGRGQCIEQYGAGEAYLPILEALQRMCHQPGGETLVGILKEHAPTWLVQLPTLVNPEEMQTLLPSILGATPVRVMRELAEAIEVLTAKHPLVLCFEDLHWLDTSSLDWLTYVARRSDPTRLLIVGTYRPTDLILNNHPLKGIKQELQIHEQCRELEVECLTEEAVREFLEKRVADKNDRALSFQTVAHVVFQRTEGNPLFMVNVVDYFLHHKLLVPGNQEWHLRDNPVATRIPTGLRQFIDLRVEQLKTEDQELLVMGSITGMEFTTATIAAVLESAMTDIDQRLHQLVRQEQFIQTMESEQWPDGTQTTKYAFHHALYQEALYEHLSETQRVKLHRKIGERLEEGYGEHTRDIAAELALHFERGHDPDRASRYHQQAGQAAFQRSAHREAVEHLRTALEQLMKLPLGLERDQRELLLQSLLGINYLQAKYVGATEVGTAFERAWELSQALPANPQAFAILFGLFRFNFVQHNIQRAKTIGTQMLKLAHMTNDPSMLLTANAVQGGPAMYQGHVTTANDHFARALSTNLPEDAMTFIMKYGEDTPTLVQGFLAFTKWTTGFPDQALVHGERCVARSRTMGHPFTITTGQLVLANIRFIRGEETAALSLTEESLTLTKKHDLEQWWNEANFLHGCLQTTLEVSQEVWDRHEQRYRALAPEHQFVLPFYHVMYAETALTVQQDHAGLTAIQSALSLIQQTDLRWFEAELTRLKGEFLLRLCRPNKAQAAQDAERCFQDAIKIARKQETKMFELRATMGLSRLWQQQGKAKQARSKLKKIYDWFTEGFDTKDLQEARALLGTLR